MKRGGGGGVLLHLLPSAWSFVFRIARRKLVKHKRPSKLVPSVKIPQVHSLLCQVPAVQSARRVRWVGWASIPGPSGLRRKNVRKIAVLNRSRKGEITSVGLRWFQSFFRYRYYLPLSDWLGSRYLREKGGHCPLIDTKMYRPSFVGIGMVNTKKY